MIEFIRNLNIIKCNKCKEIRKLQKNKSIKAAPLFWQGRGIENIPLVIMGINPSVVGTDNEPQRGCDFEEYFDYYQNRRQSEDKNIQLANGRTIPRRHWTMCHNLAKHLIGQDTPRWENYVLMEIIHCFFNKAGNLPPDETTCVVERCFASYTKNMLMVLKPKMMILLGNPPYEVFKPYLEKGIDNYEYCSLKLDGLRIPVLRHLHPSAHASEEDGGFYRASAYKDFKSYCNRFDFVCGN